MAPDDQRLIEFARSLVRTPSVVRSGDGSNEAAVTDLIGAWMRDRGWNPVRQEVAPGRHNLVAVLEGSRPGPTLCFVGHSDVVTEGDPAAWLHDPFGADVEAGRLWGRGAADMKGGLAAMLFAADAITALPSWAGRVVVAVLVDEEGLMLGAKHFARSEIAHRIDAALVCEPEGGELCLVQKGAMRIVFSVTGRMAHGAMPDHGINPLPALAELVRSVHALEAELHGQHGAYEHLGLPFLTPTVLSAGSIDALNVVPPHGLLAIDVRSTPAVEHPVVLDALRRRAEEVSHDSGCRIDMDVVDDRPATETPLENDLAQAVLEAHRDRYGTAPPLGGVPGTTDGTILWRDAGIPVVVYGPGGKWIAHQANEYVEIDELTAYAEVYREAALRFLDERRTS